MTNYFIITVLFIYGVHATTRPGMLLSFIPDALTKLLFKTSISPDLIIKIQKPLFDCTPCMASVYGTISHFLLFPHASFIALVIWVFSISGFNYILNKFLNR